VTFNKEKPEEIVKIVNDFINLVENIEEEMSAVNAEYTRCNNTELNLKHDFENKKFDVFKGYYMGKDFQRLRNYRRKVSNCKEVLEPVFNFCLANKAVLLKMSELKVRLNKLLREQKEWKYVPREPAINLEELEKEEKLEVNA
jgi:Mg2+ and Co2+ transporter CorA